MRETKGNRRWSRGEEKRKAALSNYRYEPVTRDEDNDDDDVFDVESQSFGKREKDEESENMDLEIGEQRNYSKNNWVNQNNNAQVKKSKRKNSKSKNVSYTASHVTRIDSKTGATVEHREEGGKMPEIPGFAYSICYVIIGCVFVSIVLSLVLLVIIINRVKSMGNKD